MTSKILLAKMSLLQRFLESLENHYKTKKAGMDPLYFRYAGKLLVRDFEFLMISDFFKISFIAVMVGIHPLL